MSIFEFEEFTDQEEEVDTKPNVPSKIEAVPEDESVGVRSLSD